MDELKEKKVLLCDGAMGTFLQAKGLQAGECPELWCLTHPEEVMEIHRQYRNAGSNIVECNSFGANRYKLLHYQLQNKVYEINKTAAVLASTVAGSTQYVLGSAGPTGTFMEPYGDETEEKFYETFKEQMMALEAGGADMVIVETMTSLEEAKVAVKAALENTKLVVIASFTFDPQPNGNYATMMGLTPEKATEEMIKAGAHIVGTNCGTGPDHMIEIVKKIKTVCPSTIPVIAMPNAGMPVLEDGKTIFKETPEEMGKKALLMVEAGASIVGGCCGTGPAHIAAMHKAIYG